MRPWQDEIIAHGPAALADVRRWAVGTIRLLRREFGRL